MGKLEARVSDEADTRLTKLGDDMTVAMTNNALYREGDKAIILLQDGSIGGITTYGYEDVPDVIANAVIHLRGMLETQGMDLQVHAIPGGDPQDN